MIKRLLVVGLISISLNAFANSDSLMNKLTIGGYLESYYSYDFGRPRYSKPRFYLNHNKHNEIAINLALLKVNYNSEKFRANLGLMTGTYSEKNYTYRDEKYNNIYELNAGIKLFSSKNIWLDVGIFPSHLGLESAIGIESWTLTRSIQAEASPYYEAGARVSYTSQDNKLYLSVLVLNGWQQINKNSNYPLSFGHQLTYKPTDKVLLNSSSFIGNSNGYYHQIRYFHNLHTQIQWNKHLATTLGFDVGTDRVFRINDINYYQFWYSPIFMVRYSKNDKDYFAFRAEQFNDFGNRVLISDNGEPYYFTGYSINYDHKFNQFGTFRIEAKKLQSDRNVFINKTNYSNSNFAITTALIFNLTY